MTEEDKVNKKIDDLSAKVDALYERSLSFYHKEAIGRMDRLYERVESKIDDLESSIKEDSKNMQTELMKRLESVDSELNLIDNKVVFNSNRITKHEANFGILNFLITSGLGALLAMSAWISGLFTGGNGHH